jgi:hypothetical protein
MKRPLAFSLLLVILGAAPSSAPAQNIWPISFDFWGHHPDKLAHDIHGADESIARAQALGRLYDIQIRPAMNQRAATMSLQELGLYNRQPLFTAVYPEETEPAPSVTPSSSSSPSRSSPTAPASGAPPSSSGSPFPSSSPTPGTTSPVPSSPGPSVPAAPFAPGPDTTPSTSAAPSPSGESSGAAPRAPKP